MKRVKILFATFLTIILFSGGVMAQTKSYKVTEQNLEYGYVQIYDFGSVKLHAYQTADLLADESFVLETNKGLIAIESPAFNHNLVEWKQYLDTMNKPLTDILLSSHPTGGKWYGNAKSHATSGAIKAMTTGQVKALADSLKQSFGHDFNAEIPSIDAVLNAGINTISGLEFEIIEAGDSYDIVIPKIKVSYTHMLGADSHSILAGQAHINALLASLNNMQTKGYQLILSGHHTPETQSDVITKIAYINKIQQIATQSTGKEDFISRVKKAYPEYTGLNYLDMTASYLFTR